MFHHVSSMEPATRSLGVSMVIASWRTMPCSSMWASAWPNGTYGLSNKKHGVLRASKNQCIINYKKWIEMIYNHVHARYLLPPAPAEKKKKCCVSGHSQVPRDCLDKCLAGAKKKYKMQEALGDSSNWDEKACEPEHSRHLRRHVFILTRCESMGGDWMVLVCVESYPGEHQSRRIFIATSIVL
jgi:hypothetical protein